MSQLFFNNAQMEKYDVLRYILNLHKDEATTQYYSKLLSADRHRIRTINKDLVNCDVELKIKSNLGYEYIQSVVQEDMLEYYNKKTLTKYYHYLLNQSNLFHLISYLINNSNVTIEAAAYDLSISNSYIYKLVSHFNQISGPRYGVTIEIVKRHLAFVGDEDKLIVALFAFYSISPQTKIGHYTTQKSEGDQFLESLRPLLLAILQKDEDYTDAELLFVLYKSLYSASASPHLTEEIGYDLVQEGGSLITIISKLYKHYSYQFEQVNLKDFSFYLPEVIKLIALFKVKPIPESISVIEIGVLQDEEHHEILLIERILLKENLYLERKQIKVINQIVKYFLNHSKELTRINIHVNLVESVILTKLYKESIRQLFNSNTVHLVEDINIADVIITNNMNHIMMYDESKFVYIIQHITEEFEKKDYLQFIIKIVKKLSVFK